MDDIEGYERDYCDYMDEMSKVHQQCPKCGRDYDDADFDFQICHFCGWDAIDEYYTK